MNKAQANRQKQRYFPKNYAPARAAALKSKKKSVQLAAKASLATEKAATAAKNFTRSLSHKSAKTQKTTSRPSATSYRRRSSAKHSKFTWREATLLSMIGISAVAIVATFALSSIFDPVKRSEHELEKLADAYYIEYLYPRSLGKYLNEPETVLKDYVNQGLPAVFLRQLLLYDDGKNAGSVDAFSNSYYQCDANKTYVRFYPVEPYGPRDYTIKYGTACEKISSI